MASLIIDRKKLEFEAKKVRKFPLTDWTLLDWNSGNKILNGSTIISGTAPSQSISLLSLEDGGERYLKMILVSGRILYFKQIVEGDQVSMIYLPKDPQKLHGGSFVRKMAFGSEGDFKMFCGEAVRVPDNADTGSQFLLGVSSEGKLSVSGVEIAGD